MTANTDVRTDRVLTLQMTFGALPDDYPMSPGHIAEIFEGVYGLLYVAWVADWEQGTSSTRFSAHEMVNNCNYRRIAYNSPLEVVLGIAGGLSTGAYAANRLISVWNNFQLARRTTANADLWVAATNVLQAEIERPDVGPNDSGSRTIHAAARALAALSDLTVDEEDPESH